MQLFYTKRSPFARKIRLLIEEKGLTHQFDLIEEDLSAKSQSLANANPLAQIPTLLLNDGTALYDSVVIAEYIDVLNDTPRFIPEGGLQRLHVLRLQALADGMAEAAIHAFMELRRPPEKQVAATHEKQLRTVLKCCDALERDNHFHNSLLSLAHLAVASAIGYVDFRLQDIGWRNNAPTLAEWYAGFSERASMKRTFPTE